MTRIVIGILTAIVSLAMLIAALTSQVSTADADAWKSVVDARVLEAAEANGTTEFFVFLSEQADLSGVSSLQTKEEKGAFVYEKLTEMATRNQPTIISKLEDLGVDYEPYWIANMIWVHGDLATVQTMAERADVSNIYANTEVQIELTPASRKPLTTEDTEAIGWNLQQVSADDVWALGYRGKGVVVAGVEGGHDWDHPVLKNQYRGWNGSSVDHNYNWYDGAVDGNDDCSNEPCVSDDLGTVTMSIMVGDDGQGNQTGIAPDAKWIACRHRNDDFTSLVASYIKCYQWFLAPTDLNGQNAIPAMAPHIINSPFTCLSRWCPDLNVLSTIINNLRAAGILTVQSTRNDGPDCSTIQTPPAIYDAAFTVGSTSQNDTISDFSSRGPITVDGSNRLKPDITAPGEDIRVAVPGGGYEKWNGVSIAGPHVTGLAALLISANPLLSGQPDQLEIVIEQGAVPKTTNQSCGGVPGSQIPNNTYGYGRIDALESLSKIPYLTVAKSAPADIRAGELLMYTINVDHFHPLNSTTNVVVTDVVPLGTDFVSATAPYTQVGSEIRWQFASLDPEDSRDVIMVVRVSDTKTGFVVNDQYGVISDQFSYMAGRPWYTVVGEPEAYLPVVQHDYD